MEERHDCGQMGKFGKLESDIKTIFKRIDEQLTIVKAVYDLAAEVRVMNERMENLTRAQNNMKNDLDELKATPKHRMNAIVTAAISAIVGGIIAYAFFIFGMTP